MKFGMAILEGTTSGGRASSRYWDALLRRPRWTLLCLVILSGLGAWWGAGIQIRGDLEDLFPDDTPVVQRARAARAILGQRSQLLILVGGPDKALNRVVGQEITLALEAEEGLISSVAFHRDISFFEKNALLYLEVAQVQDVLDEVSNAISQAVMVDDFEFEEDLEVDSAHGGAGGESRIPTRETIAEKYKNQELGAYFESPDGQVLAIKATPTFKPTETGRGEELNRIVQQALDAAKAKPGRQDITFSVEGEYSQLAKTVDTIRSELKLATVVALATICLILLVGFRRLRAIVLVLFPLLVGLAWTLFAARLAVGYLNIITAFIFAILVGLGIDFVLHGVGRVEEDERKGHDLRDALQGGLTDLGPSMLAAGLTTMATFAVLITFDFRGFSQFGFLAATGVLACLAALYVFYPPLALSLERLLPRRVSPQAAAETRSPRPRDGSRKLRALAGLAIYVAVALTAWGASSLGDVVFEADTRAWRTKVSRTSSELVTKYRREASQRPNAPALVVTAGLAETQALHASLHDRLAGSDLLQEVRSIYTFVPEEQDAKLALVREIKRKLDNKADYLEEQAQRDAADLRRHLSPSRFDADDLPEWLKAEFRDSEGRFGRYVLLYFKGVKSNAAHVMQIRQAFEQISLGDTTFTSTASYYILAEVYRVVKEDGPRAVAYAALVIFIFLLLFFRGVGDALLVFIPLVVAFVTLMGILAASGISLNIFNIVVLPIIFGIGVDTSIHLVSRLNRGCSLHQTLATAGKAGLLSSATTIAGFLSLLVVSNDGLQSLGLVAAIGVAAAFIASTTLCSAAVLLGWKKVGTPTG